LLYGALWSCGDTPTDGDPQAPENLAQVFFERAPEPGYAAHTWRDAGIGDFTVTQTIGREGGVIEFQEVGTSIVFPKGALAEDVTIEARAIAGPIIAFEFSRHGIEFQAPVQIRIDSNRLTPGWHADSESTDLLGTRQDLRQHLWKLIGVYYTGSHESGKSVAPLESLPMYYEGGDVVLKVRHFSGYAVASG